MTRSVRTRVENDEYEIIRNNAKIRGFQTVSSFIRAIATEQDFTTKQKVNEIHEFLLGSKSEDKNTKKVKPKRNNALTPGFEPS